MLLWKRLSKWREGSLTHFWPSNLHMRYLTASNLKDWDESKLLFFCCLLPTYWNLFFFTDATKSNKMRPRTTFRQKVRRLGVTEEKKVTFSRKQTWTLLNEKLLTTCRNRKNVNGSFQKKNTFLPLKIFPIILLWFSGDKRKGEDFLKSLKSSLRQQKGFRSLW